MLLRTELPQDAGSADSFEGSAADVMHSVSRDHGHMPMFPRPPADVSWNKDRTVSRLGLVFKR